MLFSLARLTGVAAVPLLRLLDDTKHQQFIWYD
jgi:hypothetical protein